MGSQRPITGQQRVPSQTGVGAVRIWLLGGFRISVGSSRSIGEDEWRLKKSASLLKLLALAPAHRLHREQAMDLLWPELDSKAAQTTSTTRYTSPGALSNPRPALLPATCAFGARIWPCPLRNPCGWT